jgi:hypothetical protein
MNPSPHFEGFPVAALRSFLDQAFTIVPEGPRDIDRAETGFTGKLHLLQQMLDELRRLHTLDTAGEASGERLSRVSRSGAGFLLHVGLGPVSHDPSYLPRLLAEPLLGWLDSKHPEGVRPLNAIRAFVDDHRSLFGHVAFQRTATGVPRTQTYVRQAARILRTCGLLLYGPEERHKRWRLSWMGLCALEAWTRTPPSWKIIGHHEEWLRRGLVGSPPMAADWFQRLGEMASKSSLPEPAKENLAKRARRIAAKLRPPLENDGVGLVRWSQSVEKLVSKMSGNKTVQALMRQRTRKAGEKASVDGP